MRILSYNIRKAVGLDGRRNPERVLSVIADSGADVVILQEADKRLGARPAAIPKRLIDLESDYDVVDVATTDLSLGWHGNAVLVKAGVTVLATERLNLPGLEPRGAVRVTVDAPATGRVDLIGAHLGLLRRWRRRQLAAIRSHVEPHHRQTTIIAGDFNEWSVSGGFEPLGRDFMVMSPGRSFHASYPVAPLDRFAHGSGLSLTDCGVIRTSEARRASDHLPVWAEFASAPERADAQDK
ncbi:endonuclease/exonuclease/phosphatase family protein [Roseibacterium beibuensis]|uniref:Endonuclease/exonuclease/phosphatase family protein n=1 Tax=[Roseibacterium] beibuensis TaxID=1193142 RepID=A0ABP9L8E3_9RHOB|nr:endonuclease/exonuclease/phosphatase family protein [Roseibacterium beibuensis]MCS6624301.1 endonuclease/exonuclease/phosphatase family protein [Roseibacterium beibuensis]